MSNCETRYDPLSRQYEGTWSTASSGCSSIVNWPKWWSSGYIRMVLGTLLGLKTASLAVKLGSQGVDLPNPMLAEKTKSGAKIFPFKWRHGSHSGSACRSCRWLVLPELRAIRNLALNSKFSLIFHHKDQPGRGKEVKQLGKAAKSISKVFHHHSKPFTSVTPDTLLNSRKSLRTVQYTLYLAWKLCCPWTSSRTLLPKDFKQLFNSSPGRSPIQVLTGPNVA